MDNKDKIQNLQNHFSGDIFSDKDISSYELDGITPGCILTPANTDSVCEILNYVSQNKISVLPWGGGTRINIGRPPSQYDTAINMNIIDGIIEYEPADLTVITSAGTKISNINKVLRENNQCLPLNVPYPEEATAGGVLASNSSGFLRQMYGTARDMTLGLKFVEPGGKLIKAGGKVAKNVAGYDMTKLMIGSFGSLGIVTESAFRVRPIPEYRLVQPVSFSDMDDIRKYITTINNSFYRPSYSITLNDALDKKVMDDSAEKAGYVLLLGFEGVEETVKKQVEETKEVLSQIKHDLLDTTVNSDSDEFKDKLSNIPGDIDASVIFKSVVPPKSFFDFHKVVSDYRSREFNFGMYSMPENGITYLLFYDDQPEDQIITLIKRLREKCLDMGGHLTVEKAALNVKQQVDIWTVFKGNKLMKALKNKFDPENILCPGRFI